MRIIFFAVASLLLSQPAIAKAYQVAVECSGLETTTIQSSKKQIKAKRTKIYIIDESNRDVSYYNPEYGRAVSRCEGVVSKCEFEFSPKMIILTARSVNMIINRGRGTLWELMFLRGNEYNYSAVCHRTTAPRSDVPPKKF